MMPDFGGWSSEPHQLQGLCSVVARARVMVACLRQEAGDRDARVEVVRLTGAIVGHADREDWLALGNVAGSLVRLLSTRRGDAPLFEALDGGFDEIERLIDERMART